MLYISQKFHNFPNFQVGIVYINYTESAHRVYVYLQRSSQKYVVYTKDIHLRVK